MKQIKDMFNSTLLTLPVSAVASLGASDDQFRDPCTELVPESFRLHYQMLGLVWKHSENQGLLKLCLLMYPQGIFLFL